MHSGLPISQALSKDVEFSSTMPHGLSAPNLDGRQDQYLPIDAYVALQPQSLSSTPYWDNDQWGSTSAPYSQHGQWTMPVAETQPDLNFFDDLVRPNGINLDHAWTDLTGAIVTAPMEPIFDVAVTTQAQQATIPPSSIVNSASPVDEEILTCPRGCSATFGRPGDYRRHMRNHQPHKFKCMFADCDKTFPRMDKLNDHFRQGHRSNVKVSRAAARTNPKKSSGEKRTRR